ncbi:unnamed protein product [Microthlaspi erraticum]|uniref:Uncharacterized protein n=1 Tax=Microthlaspi erraticum TaxID=1685480 RepID=A0A6D2HWF9_9BRAS|nr:unnamed protein product [Microthlaspi erraticum]
MRRHIEEVNLCVTITDHVNGVPAKATFDPPAVTKARDTEDIHSSEASETEETNNDEWHQFAMSETPMTFPSFGNTEECLALQLPHQ